MSLHSFRITSIRPSEIALTFDDVEGVLPVEGLDLKADHQFVEDACVEAILRHGPPLAERLVRDTVRTHLTLVGVE